MAPPPPGDGTWFVYVLRCADGSLYTGVTNDVARRVAAHARGRGAKYTRGRAPLVLVHVEFCPDRSAALRRERALKRLPATAKRALVRARAAPASPSASSAARRGATAPAAPPRTRRRATPR